MLRRNLIANYLGQGWSAIMGLAFVPTYIAFLGMEAYALVGVFTFLQAWLQLLDMGMKATLSRELARFTAGSRSAEWARDLLRSCEVAAASISVLIILGLLISASVFATSWVKAEELSTDSIAQAFSIMACVVALRFIEGIYASCLIGLQRQVLLNVFVSAMATIRGVGAVGVLAFVSPTIETFFVWQLFVSLMTLLALGVATYVAMPSSSRPGRFSLGVLRQVGRFAGGMFVITLSSLVLAQADKVLLSTMLSLEQFGYYAFAATIAGSLYMVVAPVTQAWFPRLSEFVAMDDMAEFARTYHRGAQILSVALGSVAAFLICLSDPFLSMWTGDEMLSAEVAPLLSILVTGSLLNGLLQMPSYAQLAHGWVGLTIRINLIAVLCFVPAILVVVPELGGIGAAWLWVALNCAYLFVGIHFMHRRILQGEKLEWYVDDLLKPVLAAIVVAGTMRLLMPEGLTGLLRMSFLGASALLVFLSAAMSAGTVRALLVSVMGTLVTERASRY